MNIRIHDIPRIFAIIFYFHLDITIAYFFLSQKMFGYGNPNWLKKSVRSQPFFFCLFCSIFRKNAFFSFWKGKKSPELPARIFFRKCYSYQTIIFCLIIFIHEISLSLSLYLSLSLFVTLYLIHTDILKHTTHKYTP